MTYSDFVRVLRALGFSLIEVSVDSSRLLCEYATPSGTRHISRVLLDDSEALPFRTLLLKILIHYSHVKL